MALISKKKQPKKEKAEAEKTKSKGTGSVVAAKILEQPHVTEKAVQLGEAGTYVFRVRKEANKHQVKEAVEGVYGVDVEMVRTVAPRDKKIRRRTGMGIKRGYKKAMVTLKEGQKIDIVSI